MRPSVLVVPYNSSSSRQYGLRKGSADSTVIYFGCRRCEYLNRIKPTDGASYAVSVHVTDKTVVYPYGDEHHPSCRPVPNGQLKALEINRKFQRIVSAGQEKPLDAYEKALKEAGSAGDALEYMGNWRSMDAAYYRHFSKYNATSDKGRKMKKSFVNV